MSELLTETQREFRDSIRKFFTQECPPELRRAAFDAGGREWPAQKRFEEQIAQFGLFEFFETPAIDGGGGGRDLGMIAEEAGRVLLPTPLLERLLGSAWLKHRCGVSVQDRTLASSLSTTTAQQLKLAADGTLTGSVRWVAEDPAAQQYLLPAIDTAGASHVVLVQSSEVRQRSTEQPLDRTIARQQLTFERAKGELLPSELAEHLYVLDGVMRANELAGIGQYAVQLTNEYVKTRKQFGVAIGSFQAVQHRLAEVYLQSEAVHALAAFAAWAVDNAPDQLPFAGRAALAYATEQVPLIVETAVQLHGGIGFTWEYDLHLYVRRARMIAALYAGTQVDEAVLLEAAQRS